LALGLEPTRVANDLAAPKEDEAVSEMDSDDIEIEKLMTKFGIKPKQIIDTNKFAIGNSKKL